MASFDPSEDDIAQFLAVVAERNMSRGEVIARLKGNNNNLDQAINELFDDTSDHKYKWDENAFSNQDGAPDNHGIAFDIHAPDEPGPYAGRYDGAPSRPPSRTSNNRSPHGKVIDLTAEHAAADPRTSMTYDEQNDHDLQQALALSVAEQNLPPQQSGITAAQAVQFGPANRSQNEYAAGQWEMVTVSKSVAQEGLPDPEPAKRKRDPDAPAFLKPSMQGNRLGPLFTIYHEIPLLRNLFINRHQILPSYGNDREWWAGKRIELPTANGQHEDVDREIQRLMAFLDNTDRSYGSAEPLLQHPDVRKQHGDLHPDAEGAVLFAWKTFFEQSQGMVRQVFSVGVQQEEHEDMEDRLQKFAILDLKLPAKDDVQETLYDIADGIIWPYLDVTKCSYISHIAEVISFRVEGGEDHKPIDFPAVWYPDRYLKSSREAALKMRVKKRDIWDEHERVSKMEDNLTRFRMRSGKTVNVQDLFKASLKHDEAEIKENGESQDVEDVDMMSSQPPGSAAAKLSSELRKVMDSIDKKLIALNEEKVKAKNALRDLSKLYTEPSTDPESPQLHPYTLRGVSTTENKMYICRRAEEDLIDMGDDGDASASKKDQWWRIHYATYGADPVTVEKTTEEEVLEAAKTESKKILLVYASEKAMAAVRDQLPDPLKTFVHHDNRFFKAEILETAPDSQTVDDASPSVGLSSPGKRKFDDLQMTQDTRSEGRIKVSEREVGNSDEPSHWEGAFTGQPENEEQGHEMIVGIDPSLLTNNGREIGQEMTERSGLPILSRQRSNTPGDMIDSMDLDQVMEDENVSKESAAVKHVEFAE